MVRDFAIYAPISKINKEKRTVAGWATTEQIDKQSEVVDYNGSKEAFANWQGNIREMHEPKAVGKAVEIIPNDDEKKIWVEAHISKGAEDTWQKVLDGTLAGFSIGGQTVHKTMQVIKDASSGVQRPISRIMKYKLNELSLVDNPANPECSLALIKSIDGIPFQTELVEDNKKLVISDLEDPLKVEVTEYREKADALIKKVLDRDELDSLGDDAFGIIRKYVKDGVNVKERMFPMPDKVHAVRVLKTLNKFSLNQEEQDTIHKKAKSILGAAYEGHVTNRGGTEDMSNENIDKIVSAIENLGKRVEAMEKAMEGPYKPVVGSKETPKEATYTPAIGESSATEGDTSGSKKPVDESTANAADAPEVKPTAVESETANNAPEQKIEDAKEVEKAVQTAPGKKPVDDSTANIVDAPEVKPSAPSEAGAADRAETQEEAPCVVEEPREMEQVIKPSAALDVSNAQAEPKTQEEGNVAPVKKEVEAEESAAHEAAETPEEESEEEKKKKLVEARKVADEGNDIQKLADTNTKLKNELESLRKRFSAVEETLRKPMPRKIKIEKIVDGDTQVDSEFQKNTELVKEWNRSGKVLTSEEAKMKDMVINKMLSSKFDK